MTFLSKARAFLRNIFSPRHVEADLDQAVHSHLDMLTDENLRNGMAPSDAQRAARIELGAVEPLKEQVRDQRLGNWLNSVFADCRYALRQLHKSPAFTAVAVLTLALGIGATTAIFSFADLLLDHPVSLPDLHRLVSVDHITQFQTMAEKINQQASALQFVAVLMGFFGAIAILLSAAGIYGLIAYSVAERRREIGIRMALGANPSQVLLMVIQRALSLVALGGAIGLAAGFTLAQVLSTFLYGVQSSDPTIYAVVPPLLLFVALLASLFPALRAARVDPVVTLRYD